jgi:hypothetical protein
MRFSTAHWRDAMTRNYKCSIFKFAVDFYGLCTSFSMLKTR